jgi:hypothetical protein
MACATDVQAEFTACALTRNAGPRRVAGRQARAFSVAGYGAPFGVGQVLGQPALALRQGLGVRQHHLDAIE